LLAATRSAASTSRKSGHLGSAVDTTGTPLKRLSPARLLTVRDEPVSKRTTVSCLVRPAGGIQIHATLRRPAYGFRRTIPGGLSQGSN
jgi:hypothetical protein